MNDKIKLNIYLVRHGEKSEDGSTLSKRGHLQVKLLAKRLKKVGIHRIYSSDLERCRLSAEAVSKLVGHKIIYDKSLREVEGKVKENPSKYPREIEKIRKFWTRLTSKEKGNILVVGSGNVNRVIIAAALGIDPKKSRFVQNPAGLTHFEYINKNKTRIVCINDLSHLPESLRMRQSY
ncbi:hypothetical protein COU60_04420 [Candidatus Pacearchaeota archaeon CG10_big_fil_rev_8_21_14_0_10_34_76]|nr:MAG: hypothetical protein COU60_04420 [Candidatus Pacearchaeota archaeon CG10_big_fil_rev_8_21_14_0_10_34_76]